MHRVGTQPQEALQKIPEKGHRNKHLWAGEKTMVFMKSNATTCSLGFEEGEKLQDWKSPQARKGSGNIQNSTIYSATAPEDIL